MLLAGFDAVRRGIAAAVLPALRDEYPRLWLAGDELILEALAAGADVEAMPPALLDCLFNGVTGLQLLAREPIDVSNAASCRLLLLWSCHRLVTWAWAQRPLKD